MLTYLFVYIGCKISDWVDVLLDCMLGLRHGPNA